MNWENLDITILGPAFLAGILVLSTHVPMGQEVLRRGIIFIDLAVAQIAGLGVIAAAGFGWESHGWQVQLSAATAAVLGAVLLNWTEKRWPEVQEALIGALFVLAATGGILLLANNPHGGEHLKELLVGQILWVTLDQLIPVALVYAVVLAIWFVTPKTREHLRFYVLFALAVTASVQLVGVYLVFAALIVPALVTRHLTGKTRLICAYSLGASAFAVGLSLSALYDLPSGAVVVWMMAALGFVLALMISPKARANSA